jgi:hypothetical protein
MLRKILNELGTLKEREIALPKLKMLLTMLGKEENSMT